MKQWPFKLSGLCILLLVSILTYSNNSAGTLFKGKVYLESGNIQSENKALQEAFKQVLVKISGDSRILANFETTEIANLSKRLAIEFGTIDLPSPHMSDFGLESRTGLISQYNRVSILNLLKAKSLPIWPNDRQPILLWLVIEDWDGSKRFLNPVSDQHSFRLLDYAAEKRGISIELPQIDENGSISWLPLEAWSFDEASLQIASQAYTAEVKGIIRYSVAEDQSSVGNAFFCS